MTEAPVPLYEASYLSHLSTMAPGLFDQERYRRIAENLEDRHLTRAFRVPIRSGFAWWVKAGQVCRIITPEGPQVGDFNCWNAANPRERFWAARTRQIHSAHVSVLDKLWSCLPYLRPMLTVTNDTLAYGRDEQGGRCHDLLGSRCDPYLKKLMTGEDVDHHCHSNLVRAVLPFGLTEFDIHDVLNIFQVTGLVDDRYFISPCPARSEDFFEFVAEIDLLCAISTCPGGDLSVPRWGPEARDNIAGCRPLEVEVYTLRSADETGWPFPPVADYEGRHGLARRAAPDDPRQDGLL